MISVEIATPNLPMTDNIPMSSDNIPNIISQTQDDVDDISVGRNGNNITADPFSHKHDLLTTQLNPSLDNK